MSLAAWDAARCGRALALPKSIWPRWAQRCFARELPLWGFISSSAVGARRSTRLLGDGRAVPVRPCRPVAWQLLGCLAGGGGLPSPTSSPAAMGLQGELASGCGSALPRLPRQAGALADGALRIRRCLVSVRSRELDLSPSLEAAQGFRWVCAQSRAVKPPAPQGTARPTTVVVPRLPIPCNAGTARVRHHAALPIGVSESTMGMRGGVPLTGGAAVLRTRH